MTLSRTTLVCVALTILTAAAPDRSQAKDNDDVTLVASQLVNRVSVPGNFDQFKLIVTFGYGQNLALCVTSGSHVAPEELKEYLTKDLRNKSVAQIKELIAQTEANADRRSKFLFFFGSRMRQDPTTGQSAGAGPEPESFVLEVTPQNGNYLTRLGGGEEVVLTPARCYSPSQLDQINAEVLRVLRAVVGALTPLPATQTPAIPGGIGIQKPQ